MSVQRGVWIGTDKDGAPIAAEILRNWDGFRIVYSRNDKVFQTDHLKWEMEENEVFDYAEAWINGERELNG